MWKKVICWMILISDSRNIFFCLQRVPTTAYTTTYARICNCNEAYCYLRSCCRNSEYREIISAVAFLKQNYTNFHNAFAYVFIPRLLLYGCKRHTRGFLLAREGPSRPRKTASGERLRVEEIRGALALRKAPRARGRRNVLEDKLARRSGTSI